MDMSKRAAIAISGLVFAGATALAMSATTPASAHVKAAAPFSDNGGGGGGGGGTNFYNPNQHFNPEKLINDL
jgi:Spy/CpxP family protein refolding chaperone